MLLLSETRRRRAVDRGTIVVGSAAAASAAAVSLAMVVAAPRLETVMVRLAAVHEPLNHAAPQAAVAAHRAVERAHGGRVRRVPCPPHRERTRL